MEEEKTQKQISHIEETVDIIARAVAEGFGEMREKFVEVNKNFEKIDLQFEQTNGKIEGLHRRIDAELERTLTLEGRVVKLEEAVSLIK